MIELWKVIESHPNYKVSNLGIVRGPRKILKNIVGTDGYCRVGLFLQGKKIEPYVHRLVATLFIPNPLNLPEVNHKNGDKSDNSVENLE